MKRSEELDRDTTSMNEVLSAFADEVEADVYVMTHPLEEERCQPTPVFLPGEFHGQGSLAGCSSWGPKESDMTE